MDGYIAPRIGGGQRDVRDLEEDRKKKAAFQAMMKEVGDADSDTSSDEGYNPHSKFARGRGGEGKSGGPAARAADEGPARRGSALFIGGSAGAGAGAGSARGPAAGAGVTSFLDTPSPWGDAPPAARAGGGFSEADFAAEFKATSAAVPAAPASADGAAAAGVFVHALEAKRERVSQVPRKGEPLTQCYVERVKGGAHRFFPMYKLFLEVPGAPVGTAGEFLVSGKKLLKNKTSHHLVTFDAEWAESRASANVAGKLRSNTSGSEYTIFDAGLNPDKAVTDASVRRELGCIEFEYDKMGPGRMVIVVPAVNARGLPSVWRQTPDGEASGSSSLLAAMRAGALPKGGQRTDGDKLVVLVNKRPRWDENAGGHVLNFKGRVTMSSVKNFQLQAQDAEDTVLQFGRVSKDKFTLDYGYPLNALQAFAICLSTLDSKIADSKGWDTMKRASSMAASGLKLVTSKMGGLGNLLTMGGGSDGESSDEGGRVGTMGGGGHGGEGKRAR
jgi:tubby-related protein 1